MREVNAILGKEIFLGRCGENLASFVTFNISDWQRVYGNGTAQLIHQRNGDKQPYPCVVEQCGNTVVWSITNSDVAVAGRGRVELQFYLGETLAKSETYTTMTERALGPASETPPDPYDRWMASMLSMASETQENAGAAAESASAAEQSKSAAAASASEAESSAKTAGVAQLIASVRCGDAVTAAEQAAAAQTDAQSAAQSAAQSEANAKQSAESAKADADRAEAARASIVLDEEKMSQAVEDAEASASAAAASKDAVVASAEAAAASAAAAKTSEENAAASADLASTKAARAESSANTAKTWKDLALNHKNDARTAADDAEKHAQMAVNAFVSADDAATAASQSEENAKTYADSAKLQASSASSAADSANKYKTTAMNASNTASASATKAQEAQAAAEAARDAAQEIAGGNFVDKSGDTMTGTLQFQPTDSAGYARMYKNANADGDYGLQMQDVDPDGNFMGLTLSGKLQKLEFKKKLASESEYRYTKLYDTENPPTAYEVGALPLEGGAINGDFQISNDYARVKIAATATHHAELMKNADGENDYGTILRDTNGEDVAELKLSAANGNVKLAHQGKEYILYHEGNLGSGLPDYATAIKVKLGATEWDSGGEVYKNVGGISADETAQMVTVAPAPSSMEECAKSGVYCFWQGENQLGFRCLIGVPEKDVEMLVSWQAVNYVNPMITVNMEIPEEVQHYIRVPEGTTLDSFANGGYANCVDGFTFYCDGEGSFWAQDEYGMYYYPTYYPGGDKTGDSQYYDAFEPMIDGALYSFRSSP